MHGPREVTGSCFLEEVKNGETWSIGTQVLSVGSIEQESGNPRGRNLRILWGTEKTL